MGRNYKKTQSKSQQGKPRSKKLAEYENASIDLEQEALKLDEVDDFHHQRDKVALGSEDSNLSSDDNEDQDVWKHKKEVMALNMLGSSDEDEYDVDIQDYIRKTMPGLKKKMGALEDEERISDDEADEETGKSRKKHEVDLQAWGSKKNIYYNDDAEYNDDYAEEEEEEAMRLQRERVQAMGEDDFLDGFDDSFLASVRSGKKLGSLAKNEDQDKQTVAEMNQDLEKIELDKDLQEQLPANLTKEELLERVIHESPELLDLLTEFKMKTTELKDHILPLIQRVQNGELPTNQGVSLLALKNQLLLNYCLNMVFYFYLKASGKRVQDHPVIEKLVELRLYLEKIKPLEQKLKYQIDKLVKAGVTGNVENSEDPLKFKPNLAGFADADKNGQEAAASDEDEGRNEDSKDGIYRAPKIAPVHFDEIPGAEDKRRKAAERARKQASSSRIMKDLMNEISEMPEEIEDAGNMMAASVKKDRDWERRIEAEEEMLTRLPMTRKDKRAMREQKRFANELTNLDDFGDTSYLSQMMEEDDLEFGKKKKTLRSIIKSAASVDANSADKKRKSGDDDIPYREKKSMRTDTRGEDYNRHLDEDYEAAKEDEFYEDVKASKLAAKAKKQADYESRQADFGEYEPEESLCPDDKRAASYAILKNKGLTPHRKPEQRNPRLKHRKKYETGLKKLKSIKAQVRTPGQRYAGEETGIKKNLARSVKFQS